VNGGHLKGREKTMRASTIPMLFLGPLLTFQVPQGPSATAAEEIKKLEGRWTVVAQEYDGERTPEFLLPFVKIAVKGSRLFQTSGDETYEYAMAVDPQKTPKQMNFTFTDGAGKRETIPAIYELEGDKLKICACFKGEERPTDFSAKKEGQCLWICERAK
jgi:uncharacterized protein (TIGR03067 family)